MPIGSLAPGPPVIYVFSQADDPNSLSLLPDDEGGAVLGVTHLAQIGRKRIAHITRPEHFEGVRLRKKSYLAALADSGLRAEAGLTREEIAADRGDRISAHPSVRMNAGRVRGPLYCVEEADNPGGPVQRLKLGRDAPLKVEHRGDLFGGIMTVASPGYRLSDDGWDDALYRSSAPTEASTKLTALPYYLWNNRGAGSMLVWLVEA